MKVNEPNEPHTSLSPPPVYCSWCQWLLWGNPGWSWSWPPRGPVGRGSPGTPGVHLDTHRIVPAAGEGCRHCHGPGLGAMAGARAGAGAGGSRSSSSCHLGSEGRGQIWSWGQFCCLPHTGSQAPDQEYCCGGQNRIWQETLSNWGESKYACPMGLLK